MPDLLLVPGDKVRITGGVHKGEAGEVRGMPGAKGWIPVKVRGKVSHISPKSLAPYTMKGGK